MPSGSGEIGIVEVNIQGVNCSECANGWSFSQESPYSTCNPYTITTTSPLSYLAAIPRWSEEYSIVQYEAIRDLGSTIRTYNKPNSCGCTVQ